MSKSPGKNRKYIFLCGSAQNRLPRGSNEWLLSIKKNILYNPSDYIGADRYVIEKITVIKENKFSLSIRLIAASHPVTVKDLAETFIIEYFPKTDTIRTSWKDVLYRR
jgi:hypothetical protein